MRVSDEYLAKVADQTDTTVFSEKEIAIARELRELRGKVMAIKSKGWNNDYDRNDVIAIIEGRTP